MNQTAQSEKPAEKPISTDDISRILQAIQVREEIDPRDLYLTLTWARQHIQTLESGLEAVNAVMRTSLLEAGLVK